MPLNPRRCSVLYSMSCLLDALDGYAARVFNQSTRFGAVLDMVTDRCTTSCLLVFLAIAQPAYAPIFQVLISLDFASHYMHMYATLAMGGKGQSHKDVSAGRSRIMNIYYKKVSRSPGVLHESSIEADTETSGSSSLAAPGTSSSSSVCTCYASPRRQRLSRYFRPVVHRNQRHYLPPSSRQLRWK